MSNSLQICQRSSPCCCNVTRKAVQGTKCNLRETYCPKQNAGHSERQNIDQFQLNELVDRFGIPSDRMLAAIPAILQDD